VKARTTQPFTAYVGIDWADTKHDICLQAAGDDRREFDCIPHQVARIDEWAKSVHKRFGGPIAIALELAKGPIVYALQKYDFFVLFPINPSTLAKYRIAFKPSRAKDDPTDAEFALDLVMRHPEQFEPLQPQSAAMRALLSLTEHRRELVGDKTRLTNRLANTLKQYFPQALDWFDQRDTLLFCDFLARWPTLVQVKRARVSSLKAFFHAHNTRRPEVIGARLDSIKAATSLTEDPGVIDPCRLHVLVLVSNNCASPCRPLTGLITKLPTSRPRCQTILSFKNYRVPARIWRHDCSQLSGSGANDSRGPMSCRNIPASRLSPSAVARRAGCIGDGSVQRVPAPNLCRVGGADHQQIVLGRRLLSAAAGQRQFVSSRRACAGIQVDSHPLPMLDH
jgi:hypothetical protein